MLLSAPAMLTVMLNSPWAHTKNASCASIKMLLTFCSSSRSRRGAFCREDPALRARRHMGRQTRFIQRLYTPPGWEHRVIHILLHFDSWGAFYKPTVKRPISMCLLLLLCWVLFKIYRNGIRYGIKFHNYRGGQPMVSEPELPKKWSDLESRSSINWSGFPKILFINILNYYLQK